MNKIRFLKMLCSDDRASFISKKRWDQLDEANSDLLVISCSETC
jgi:hypothetical protein